MRVDTERATDLDDLMARMERGRRPLPLLGRVDRLRGRRAARWAAACSPAATTPTLDDLPPKRRARRCGYDPHVRLAAPPLVPSGLVDRSTVAAAQRGVVPQGAARAARRAPARHRVVLPPAGRHRALEPDVRRRAASCSTSSSCPFEAEDDVVRTAIERLDRGAVPVGPRRAQALRPASEGLLSFPMPGWTLALDMPVGPPDLARVLDELDELVAEAGGRVYLAKDSRLRPELLPRCTRGWTSGARSATGSTPTARCSPTSPPARPASTSGAAAMSDAVGAVQSVLVLGGSLRHRRWPIAGAWRSRAGARGPRRARPASGSRPRPRALRAAGVETWRPRSSTPTTSTATTRRRRGVRPSRRLRRRRSPRPACSATRTSAEHDAPPRPRSLAHELPRAARRRAVASRERLRRQGHGTLVVLSSVAGERARQSNFVYGASKAGLDGFAQGLGDASPATGVGVIDRPARASCTRR